MFCGHNEHRHIWQDSLKLAAKTVGTFLLMILIWSLWTAHSFEEWKLLMGKVFVAIKATFEEVCADTASAWDGVAE